ncbi:transcriptional regulator [Gracilibacillus boraciitolerans JCM 21714]|uniref:Transcriptional regulator n=2 Tax=Gracilibacillus boraciitolerans TaxID=307521 RepID=W4VE55_9BACI|nr:transcriptional regulator [Gracilibacillus boraciitolerans JCM 21714]
MEKVIKKYLPMTETAFYILLSLTEPRHGYGIIKRVEEMTNGRLKLGSGTIYGTLTKMQRDQIITIYADEKRKTIYEITPLGKQLIHLEIKRLKEVFTNALRYEEDF